MSMFALCPYRRAPKLEATAENVQILYGLPIAPGQIARVFSIGQALGPGSISILLDHPGQVSHLPPAKPGQVVPHAYIKINMGGDRAGVVVDSEQMLSLADAALEAHHAGKIILTGLYSHAGHSYGGDSSAAALEMLQAEFNALRTGASRIVDMHQLFKGLDKPLPPLVLSVGASPTALSVQNILTTTGGDNTMDPVINSINVGFSEMRRAGFVPEIRKTSPSRFIQPFYLKYCIIQYIPQILRWTWKYPQLT
jgi:D-serine deaminase-like pyridoxal phosphate-dependent protein